MGLKVNSLLGTCQNTGYGGRLAEKKRILDIKLMKLKLNKDEQTLQNVYMVEAVRRIKHRSKK